MRSMTGFGRAQTDTSFGPFSVEIRCCNHRYGDIKVKIPRSLGELESRVTEFLKKELERGRIEVSIGLGSGGSSLPSVVALNAPLAKDYVTKARALGAELGLLDEVSLEYLLRLPDVVTTQEAEVESAKAWEDLKRLLETALASVVAMRENEGRELQRDFHERLTAIEGRLTDIEARAPEIAVEYRARIDARIKELLGTVPVDDARLANEVAFMAERSDITEETVRLRSHIQQCHALVDVKEANGRRIEFLLQEMLREANTIGSKTGDLKTIDAVLAIKAELEKLREQVQNVE